MSAEKFDPFIAEWVSFSKNPKYNLVEKCLKMAQILEYPELNISKYIGKINEMGNSLKIKIGQVKNSTSSPKILFRIPSKSSIVSNLPR